MREAIYISARSMDLVNERMDIISNNLANLDTDGYKKDNSFISSFRNQLVQFTNHKYAPDNPQNLLIHTDFSEGSLRFTQDKMNAAINGEGFFKLEDENGQNSYTRRGVFTLDNSGQLLIGGKAVLDIAGNRIKIEDPNFRIDDNGNILNSKNDQIARLNIVNFVDKTALFKKGSTEFVAALNAEEEVVENPNIKQMYLEGSNVNTAGAMIEMIGLMEMMRQFEIQQKMVVMQDDATGKIINDAGKV